MRSPSSLGLATKQTPVSKMAVQLPLLFMFGVQAMAAKESDVSLYGLCHRVTRCLLLFDVHLSKAGALCCSKMTNWHGYIYFVQCGYITDTAHTHTHVSLQKSVSVE